MWEEGKHCYSEEDMLKLLKSAPKEKLMEFILQITRSAKDGK